MLQENCVRISQRKLKCVCVLFCYWVLTAELLLIISPAACLYSFKAEALNNSMEQISYWGTDSRLTSQEILHLLWILKVHYHATKILPLDPIMRQPN